MRELAEDSGCNELDYIQVPERVTVKLDTVRAGRLRLHWQTRLLCRYGPRCLCWEVLSVPQGREAQVTFTLRCKCKNVFSWRKLGIQKWPVVLANFINHQITIFSSWWRIQTSFLHRVGNKSKCVYRKGQQQAGKSSHTSHMKRTLQIWSCQVLLFTSIFFLAEGKAYGVCGSWLFQYRIFHAPYKNVSGLIQTYFYWHLNWWVCKKLCTSWFFRTHQAPSREEQIKSLDLNLEKFPLTALCKHVILQQTWDN